MYMCDLLGVPSTPNVTGLLNAKICVLVLVVCVRISSVLIILRNHSPTRASGTPASAAFFRSTSVGELVSAW